MDIGFYIADLLRNQDEVSLPGLGTFAKQKVPGSFNKINNSFVPPSYQLTFTKEISEFNSLSEFISFKKNLSLSSAEYFVKKYIMAILDLLQTSGVAEINPLGLIRQENENLTFEASTNFEIAGKFYGLKPVIDFKNTAQPPVQENVDIPAQESGEPPVAEIIEAPVHEVVETPDQKTTKSPVQEPVETPVQEGGFIENFITGQGEIEEDEEEDVFVGEKRGNRILLLLFGGLLLAALSLALLYLFHPTTRNYFNRFLPASISGIPAMPDSVLAPKTLPIVLPDSTKTDSLALRDSIIKDSVSTPKLDTEIPEREEIVTKIEIIGATFGKRSEAELYVNTMKAKGLPSKIADDMPGRLFKVSLGSFTDDQSAQKELNRIIKEVEKTAWIAKYKSKKKQ